MKRHRKIAAAPERTTSESATVISDLIRDTLTCSEKLDSATIDDALVTARPALLALTSGGHLDRDPLVVVAAQLQLSITTVTGDGALMLEENLDAVPGAASEEDWTLYLPPSPPLGALVESIASGHPNLSAEAPPKNVEQSSHPNLAAVDLDALLRRQD